MVFHENNGSYGDDQNYVTVLTKSVTVLICEILLLTTVTKTQQLRVKH